MPVKTGDVTRVCGTPDLEGYDHRGVALLGNRDVVSNLLRGRDQGTGQPPRPRASGHLEKPPISLEAVVLLRPVKLINGRAHCVLKPILALLKVEDPLVWIDVRSHYLEVRSDRDL